MFFSEEDCAYYALSCLMTHRRLLTIREWFIHDICFASKCVVWNHTILCGEEFLFSGCGEVSQHERHHTRVHTVLYVVMHIERRETDRNNSKRFLGCFNLPIRERSHAVV